MATQGLSFLQSMYGGMASTVGAVVTRTASAHGAIPTRSARGFARVVDEVVMAVSLVGVACRSSARAPGPLTCRAVGRDRTPTIQVAPWSDSDWERMTTRSSERGRRPDCG